MNKKNIVFRIFGVVLTLITVSQFLGTSCESEYARIDYDSVEALQAAWPDYYYFDFNLQNIYSSGGYAISYDYEYISGFLGCSKINPDINYIGYRIWYRYYSYFSNAWENLTVESDSTKTEIPIGSEGVYFTIEDEDGDIDVLLTYYKFGMDRSVTFYFELENVLYRFRASVQVLEIDQEEFVDYFKSIFINTVKGRYKGPKI